MCNERCVDLENRCSNLVWSLRQTDNMNKEPRPGTALSVFWAFNTMDLQPSNYWAGNQDWCTHFYHRVTVEQRPEKKKKKKKKNDTKSESQENKLLFSVSEEEKSADLIFLFSSWALCCSCSLWLIVHTRTCTDRKKKKKNKLVPTEWLGAEDKGRASGRMGRVGMHAAISLSQT